MIVEDEFEIMLKGDCKYFFFIYERNKQLFFFFRFEESQKSLTDIFFQIS